MSSGARALRDAVTGVECRRIGPMESEDGEDGRDGGDAEEE